MAAEGAQVAVLDLDGDSAAAVADEVGGVSFAVDVRDPDAVRAAVDEAAARLGGLDTIFNNAGTGGMARLHEYEPDEFRRVVDVNLHGVWHGIRAAVPHMLAGGGGSIVNTASISGIRPSPGEGPYSAAKAAIVALTQSAALEYGARGIRVNAVAPGMVDTDIRGDLMSQEIFNKILSTIPMGRIASPREIASVFLFLASDLSSFVTGATIDVNGGMFIH